MYEKTQKHGMNYLSWTFRNDKPTTLPRSSRLPIFKPNYWYLRSYGELLAQVILLPREGEEKLATYVQRQGLAGIGALVAIDAHQRFAALEKASLQADDYELHAGTRVIADVRRDLGDVGVVQSGVDFVQHEEGRRLVAVHGEQEGQRRHGFLASGEVLHVAEPLEGRHGVVFDSVQVGFVAVFHVQIARGIRLAMRIIWLHLYPWETYA